MKRSSTVVVGLLVSVLLPGCGEDKDKNCPIGTETCNCTQGGSCDPGLICQSNICIDTKKKTVGEECVADAECQSGRCVEEEVEGIKVKRCTSGPALTPDGGSPPAGSCLKGTTVVPNGKHYCDGKSLFLCQNGTGALRKSCSSCYYIGAGTGSKYATNCRSYDDGEEPDSWSTEQKTKYVGPGCYFGYDLICGP